MGVNMKEFTFCEALNDKISGTKEFHLDIKGHGFTVNATNISEFVPFLKKKLKNTFNTFGLLECFDTLSVNDIQNAYFPHKKSPIHFPSLWSKSGLPYSIKRIK